MRTSLRKSPRLKGFDYAGPYGYTVTVVTRRRQPVFRNANIVEIAREALRRACHQYGFTLHAYCFMPDHVHLLVSGNADSRLPEFVHLFKQLSGFMRSRRSALRSGRSATTIALSAVRKI